ncbi:MAG: hypothetical protein IIX92_05490, partial [Selenomonadales bacterium]|nr:hypothetical protein [Selenomonadales bacterium]
PRTYTELQYTKYNSGTREVINSKTYSSYEQKAEYIPPCGWQEELYEAAFSIKYPEFKKRMKMIWTDDTGGAVLDTATIEYSSYGNIATYWIFSYDNKNSAWFYEQINKSARTTSIQYAKFKSGTSYTPPEKKSQRIIPESNGEAIFRAVFPN